MGEVGDKERKVQDRVVNLLQKQWGYHYLGNWSKNVDSPNVDPERLTANLQRRVVQKPDGSTERTYDDNVINRALRELEKAAAVSDAVGLYGANKQVYELLRYGVKVRPAAGENMVTVFIIDWKDLANNDFAFAEEVTVSGTSRDKRPDLVFYVNGLALATLELKRSTVTVSEGIRQTIGNQRNDFIEPFFSTVQLVLAGNDVEGLRYGAIKTPEKYWLRWKLPRDIDPETRTLLEQQTTGIEGLLDEPLVQVLEPGRFLELVHDFTVFDAGVRKTCRPNQYFGVKAAQRRMAAREGGIIWHTQGSGKSLTMVWLAKWIRHAYAGKAEMPRVLVITDREELDQQIETVFKGVGEDIYRTDSARDLIGVLNQSQEWLMCSLVHKFGRTSEKEREEDAAEFLKELRAFVPDDFKAKGDLFVFVDEAHRTQSGSLHEAMTRLLPGAMFIGFTGTPLLKKDKATTIERFGTYIHTYKFDEAVDDGVVLDLRYEARDIDQDLSSPEKVDQWFEAKTRGLTDLSKAELKKRWATQRKVSSSASRARQIVDDIELDMLTKPRLMDKRGNALLVTDSVYQACKFYELFAAGELAGQCAIVTSYQPNAADISKEDTGEARAGEQLRKYEIYRKMLAAHFGESEDAAMGRVEQFEREVKEHFIKEPGRMRLLIVVDKLLTGFDSPSATYLYIDKSMRDHALFQAICRVNRLDGDDKDYGYVVDYCDLFKSLESAVTDYTSGALEDYDKSDVDGLLKDRVENGREALDDALEQIRAIVEPVLPPKETLQYQRYFCAADPGDAEQLKANEHKRVELYKAVSTVVRAFANLANDMADAGYSREETASIRAEIRHYVDLRGEVKIGAGENVDFKAYEADMRALLDKYVFADPSRLVTNFDDQGLIELIGKFGAEALGQLPPGLRGSADAVAETVVNNMRKVIVEERALNPVFYDKMSKLLDDIIDARRQAAIDYEDYLNQLLEAARRVGEREDKDEEIPGWAKTPGQRALVTYFRTEVGYEDGVEVALEVDEALRLNKPADWIGHPLKEKRVNRAVQQVLPDGWQVIKLEELMAMVKCHHEYH